MANRDNVMGFIPLWNMVSKGAVTADMHPVVTNAQTVSPGDALTLVAAGTVQRAAAGNPVYGISLEYVVGDGTKKVAVVTNPFVVFKVQVAGALAATDIGTCIDLAAGAGGTTVSTMEGDDTSSSADDGQFKVLGLYNTEQYDNAWGANQDCLVIINESFFKAVAGI